MTFRRLALTVDQTAVGIPDLGADIRRIRTDTRAIRAVRALFTMALFRLALTVDQVALLIVNFMTDFPGIRAGTYALRTPGERILLNPAFTRLTDAVVNVITITNLGADIRRIRTGANTDIIGRSLLQMTFRRLALTVDQTALLVVNFVTDFPGIRAGTHTGWVSGCRIVWRTNNYFNPAFTRLTDAVVNITTIITDLGADICRIRTDTRTEKISILILSQVTFRLNRFALAILQMPVGTQDGGALERGIMTEPHTGGAKVGIQDSVTFLTGFVLTGDSRLKGAGGRTLLRLENLEAGPIRPATSPGLPLRNEGCHSQHNQGRDEPDTRTQPIWFTHSHVVSPYSKKVFDY
jgi:hypothetical protein